MKPLEIFTVLVSNMLQQPVYDMFWVIISQILLFLNFPRRMSLKTQFKIEFFYRSTEVVWCLNKTPVPIKRKDLLVICPNHPGVLKVKASNKQINML